MLRLLENNKETRILIPLGTAELLAMFMESPTLQRLSQDHNLSGELRTARSVGIVIRLGE
jgi:hypothetical protein